MRRREFIKLLTGAAIAAPRAAIAQAPPKVFHLGTLAPGAPLDEKNPLTAIYVYFIEPLTDPFSLQEIVVKATPLAPPGTNGPLSEAAWVIKISDPERRRKPNPAVLQRRFGLTPAEAAVVLGMLPPRSEDEAARRRGVAKSTLRAQLHAAYGKLGISSRDELVHLLASYGFR